MSKPVGTVIAVTPSGPLRFNDLDAALASTLVDLIDPIFLKDFPIDVTLIRGPGLDGYERGVDPWNFLTERALDGASQLAPRKRPIRGE